jgi:hypothetical protein
MPNKQFAERLNKELDNIGVPERSNERIDVFAKLIKVHRFKAESILNGNTSIDPLLLKILADELEVDADWLIGKTDSNGN